MAKPTRTAEQLQQLVLERIEAIPDLRGQVTDVHRGGVIGIPSEEGDPNWTVRVVSDRGTHRADIARIIRTLQGAVRPGELSRAILCLPTTGGGYGLETDARDIAQGVAEERGARGRGREVASALGRSPDSPRKASSVSRLLHRRSGGAIEAVAKRGHHRFRRMRALSDSVPVARRFYGEVDRDQVARSRYYEGSKRIDTLEGSLKAAKKGGDAATVERLQRTSPEVGLINANNRVQQAIQKLNKQAVQVIGHRETMREIDQRRFETMRVLSDAIRDVERAQRSPTIAERLRDGSPR